MEYEPVNKASLRMGVGIRTIQKWAKEGKIIGAKKVGRDWMIPVVDKSVAENKSNDSPILKLFITNMSFLPGTCYEKICNIVNPDERNIALGEYYYYCGEFEKASEILEHYLYSGDSAYKCTAALICAFSNLSHKHTHMTDYVVGIIAEQIKQSYKNDTDCKNKALAVFVASTIATEFHYDIKDIPPLEDYLKYLPDSLKLYACYLMAYRFYFEKDFSRSLGVIDTAIACSKDVYPISMAYLHIIAAVNLINLMNVEEAKNRIYMAWDLLGKDNLLIPFVEHHGTLHGLIEVCFKKKYPEAYTEIINIVKGFNSGWYKYHNRKTGRNVADNLTTTEFTIAMLYNRGWKVKEIASHIELSERTVKNYLQIVYEKLGINGKKELEQYMLK